MDLMTVLYGQALAVFGVLYPFVGGCISVTPDFEHQVLKGSAYLKRKDLSVAFCSERLETDLE